ncbi:MAG TPA: hypothetical protein PLO37_19985 [Candidatus Hydrogenedentes bacterium]|nr:hypothetical protein [Candidatus Hydrogenedentota bacterium]HPG69136.1 hypothetical protein [Candidatus Hydrogenedentota bacterium]
MALILAFMAILVILGAVTLIVGRVQSSKSSTDATVDGLVLDEACKAGLDYGIEFLWHQYIVGNGNTTGNLASYRLYADNVLNIPNNEDLNGNGRQDADEYDSDGDGTFEIAEPLALVDPGDESGYFELKAGGARVAGLTIGRTDDPTGSVFTLRSTGQVGERTKTVVQTVRISGLPFTGYEYAVLAKNINCILCHAEFRALDLETNTDAAKYGDFDRIKVATLESLLFRKTTADSNIAGTVYTRGNVYDEYSNLMTADQLASSDLRGYDFDRSNGKILQDTGSGAMTSVSLVDAELDDQGRPEQFANLYKNYPSDSALQTDGALPNAFPAPFPDDDEDRYVDDEEFDTIADALVGTIEGGIAFGVPEGDLYEGSGLPTESNGAAAALANDARFNGNLILIGTEDNPIVLDGDVAVDGDLVIAGKVKGWGQLFVRGNSYLVGDVTYADAEGQYGVAEDGTPNGFALVSGGSILMGDYLTIRGKNHTADTDKYPDSGKSVRMREAHKSASVTKRVGGKYVTQTLRYGYFDPGVIDAGEIQSTMIDEYGNQVTRTGQQFSFTASELMLFNNMELDKAAADPEYKPRFYGLRDSQPDSIYTYHKGRDEHAVRYDEAGDGVQYIADYALSKGYDLGILDRAAYHYMNPRENWISEDQLRQIWWNDEQQRSAHEIARFDGLLYSNNAIFTITRSSVRHGSNTDGKMEVRGAIVCPDLGVLTPGPDVSGQVSFTLLYDRRVQQFWAPEDTTQVSFQRLVYMPETESEV